MLAHEAGQMGIEMGAAPLVRLIDVQMLVFENIDPDRGLAVAAEQAGRDEEPPVMNSDLGDRAFDPGLALKLREVEKHGERTGIQPTSKAFVSPENGVLAEMRRNVFGSDRGHSEPSRGAALESLRSEGGGVSARAMGARCAGG